MRLGVLGGTFDPVHLGHLVLAEQARQELSLDRVLFVPAGNPWRRAGQAIASAEDRLEMLRLAVEGLPEYGISTIEVARSGPSYTGETLEELSREYRGAHLFLILGQDALADLPNWHEPGRIIELAMLAVARRGGFGLAKEKSLEAKVVGISSRVRWLDMPTIAIAASDIRERVRSGHSVRFLVPAAVEEYIRRHSLYLAS